MGLMYGLYIGDQINGNDIDTEFTVVNLLSGTFVLVFLMYLYSKYSETPYKSKNDGNNLQITSRILLIWTLGRYFKGFLGLLQLQSAELLSYLSNPQSSTVGGAIIFIGQNIISEIICFIIVLDYRFIDIFLSQERANLIPNEEKSSEIITTEQDSVEIITEDYKLFYDNKDVVIIENMKGKHKGLGELFYGKFKNKEIIYRKIKFPRISEYVLEDIKKDIENLKEKNCETLNQFYGAVINSSEIGLIIAKAPRSLYMLIHEEKTIFSIDEKLNLIRDIALVLKNLHEAMLYHGHLSSRNILLFDKYKPAIADFGCPALKKTAADMLKYSNKSK